MKDEFENEEENFENKNNINNLNENNNNNIESYNNIESDNNLDNNINNNDNNIDNNNIIIDNNNNINNNNDNIIISINDTNVIKIDNIDNENKNNENFDIKNSEKNTKIFSNLFVISQKEEEKKEEIKDSKIKNIFSSIKSTISNSLNINMKKFINEDSYKLPIQLFQRVFIHSTYYNNFYKKYKKNFFYFSKRNNNNNNNFYNENLNNIFQSIFANLIFEKKIFFYIENELKLDKKKEIKKKDFNLYVDSEKINTFRYEIILLFFDNPIKLEEVMNNSEMKSFFNKSENFEKILNVLCNNNHHINNFKIEKMFSPFSLNFLKILEKFNNENNNENKIKKIIKNFELISKYFNILPNLEIFFFEKFINEKEILNKILDSEKNFLNKNCLIFLKMNLSNKIIEYQKLILKYFLIRQNKGFISKLLNNNNNYFYFIGHYNDLLITFNYNLVLENIKDEKDLLNFYNFNSFEISKENLVLINPKFINYEEIIFVFNFENMNEFNDFIIDVISHCNLNIKLFEYLKN